MALAKLIDTPSGPCAYHTVGVWGAGPGRTWVELMSYPDEPTRRLNGEPYVRQTFEWADAPALPEIYARLKQDPAWADAADA